MGKKDSIKEKFSTPKGLLHGFIAVTVPSTKFNKEGVYTVNQLISKEDGEYLLEKLKSIRTEQFKNFGKGTKLVDITRCKPFTTVTDEGEEVEDAEGRYIVTATAKANIKDGKPTNKIQLFDSKLNPIKSDIKIGEGTLARLVVTLKGYSVAGKTGVTINLNGVQIINLVEYGNGDCASLLSVEDGGFEFEESDGTVAEDTADSEEEELDF